MASREILCPQDLVNQGRKENRSTIGEENLRWEM